MGICRAPVTSVTNIILYYQFYEFMTHIKGFKPFNDIVFYLLLNFQLILSLVQHFTLLFCEKIIEGNELFYFQLEHFLTFYKMFQVLTGFFLFYKTFQVLTTFLSFYKTFQVLTRFLLFDKSYNIPSINCISLIL